MGVGVDKPRLQEFVPLVVLRVKHLVSPKLGDDLDLLETVPVSPLQLDLVALGALKRRLHRGGVHQLVNCLKVLEDFGLSIPTAVMRAFFARSMTS